MIASLKPQLVPWLSQVPGGTVRMAVPAVGEDTTEADAMARRLAHYRAQAAHQPLPPMRWDPDLPPGSCFTCGTRPVTNAHRTRCSLFQTAFETAYAETRPKPAPPKREETTHAA